MTPTMPIMRDCDLKTTTLIWVACVQNLRSLASAVPEMSFWLPECRMTHIHRGDCSTTHSNINYNATPCLIFFHTVCVLFSYVLWFVSSEYLCTMEDEQIEHQENELVSRTSNLLLLYKKQSYLQQILREYEMKLKSTCGM